MIRTIFKMLPFSLKRKKHLKFWYFYLAARLGIVQRPALNGLDEKLEKFLPYSNGTFIEVGANDGITQSNTWYFEAYKGWTGLLIEPIPFLAEMAEKFRKAPVANVALVEFSKDGEDISLIEDDLVTKVGGSEKGAVKARGRALSNLLDEYGIKDIDLFSLDVEGFEVSVLDGMDLNRHAPKFILIETADIDTIIAKIGRWYSLREKLSWHDYLLQRKEI